MRSPVRLLLLAQICLFGCLLVCILLIPHFLFESNEGGASEYGTYAKTVVPYTLGLGICGVLTMKAAILLPHKAAIRKLLLVLGVLYLSVLLSTYLYKRSTFYDSIHQLAGTALVFYSLGFGAWLSLFKVRTTTTLLLFAAQLIGFLLEILTYFGLVHILFSAELLESMAFGALLVWSVRTLSDDM